MLAMVCFGFGEIIGCFFIGWIVDKYGSKLAVVCNLFIMLSMGAFTVAFILVYKFNWLAYLMCLMWGIQDSAINTHA